MKIPEHLREPFKAAERQGWTLKQAGNGHLKLKAPPGTTLYERPCYQLIFASSPSDKRSSKNELARLRAAGVRW